MKTAKNPKGAGRPKGSPNKRTVENIDAIKATGQTPLEYLTSIYQNEDNDEVRRIDAAKAAAPYIHARLSNVEMKSIDPDTPATALPDSELQRIAKRGSNGTAEKAELSQQFAGIQSDSEH
tara:strand:+ start:8141 stop:8503 length:363 start_codon:yes stop_codon:yes gene_type:complete